MKLFGSKTAKVEETKRASDHMDTKDPQPQVPEAESDLPTPDMTFSGDKIVPDSAFKIPSPILFDSEDENSEAGDRRSHNGKDQTPVPKPIFLIQKTPKSLSIKRSKRSRMEQSGEDFDDCGGSASKKSLSSKRLLFSNQLARRRLDLGTPNSIHGDGSAKAISFKTPNTPLVNQSSYIPRQDKDYFDQFFKKIKVLGEGDFGEVFEAEKKTDGKRVAIKKSHQMYLTLFQRKQMLTEVQAHEAIPSHVNLLRFEQAWEEKGYLYIQTELCQASLQQYMDEKPVDDVMAWNLLCDILTGLAHIHDHHYIHLDIKSDNILIGQDGRYKIGDFGLLTKLDSKNRGDWGEGDNRTLAPEILESNYSTKADVFSLGLTVLAAICDIELPKNGELWHKFRNGDPFSNWGDQPKPIISTDMTEILLKMLEPLPEKRPSCRELLQSSTMRRMLDEQNERIKTSEPIKVNLKYEYKQRPVTVETPVHERIRQVLTPGKRKLDSSGTSGTGCQSNMQESPESKSNIPPSPKRKRKSSPKNLGRNIFAMVTAPFIKFTDKTLALLLTRRATNNNPEDANNMSPGIYRQRSPAITPSSNRRPNSIDGTRTPLCGSPMKSPAVSPLSSRQQRTALEEEEEPACDMSFTECTPETESKPSLKCSVSKNLFGTFDDLSSDEDIF